MNTVRRKNDQDYEIGNQQRKVESIRGVQSFEGLIEIVRLEVMPPVLRRNQEDTNCGE